MDLSAHLMRCNATVCYTVISDENNINSCQKPQCSSGTQAVVSEVSNKLSWSVFNSCRTLCPNMMFRFFSPSMPVSHLIEPGYFRVLKHVFIPQLMVKSFRSLNCSWSLAFVLHVMGFWGRSFQMDG